MLALTDLEFVIPHYETNEKEINYAFSRPARFKNSFYCAVFDSPIFSQNVEVDLASADRIEVYCGDLNGFQGRLTICISELNDHQREVSKGSTDIGRDNSSHNMVSVSMNKTEALASAEQNDLFTINVYYSSHNDVADALPLLCIPASDKEATPCLAMRLYKAQQGFCLEKLNRCIYSLKRIGVSSNSIVVESSPQSAAVNRNRGFAKTRSEWVCFLDDDVIVEEDFNFLPMRDPMGDSQVACIAPKLLNTSKGIFCADPFFDGEYVPRPRGIDEVDRGQYDYCRHAPWLPSTFLIVRRNAFEFIGGFSEEYIGSQVEDVDFSLKMREAGFKCFYVGSTSVVHDSLQRNDAHNVNSVLFAKRWAASLPRLLDGFKYDY